MSYDKAELETWTTFPSTQLVILKLLFSEITSQWRVACGEEYTLLFVAALHYAGDKSRS